MRIWRILPILPLFAVVLMAQNQATVVNAGKGWSYANKILIRGQLIEIDPAQIKPQLAGGKSAGELLLDCPRGLVKYVCDDKCGIPACADKFHIAHANTTEFPPWAKGMMRPFLTREPREVATLGVRGGGNPTDAVLLMDAKGIHWGPALARVLEGRYCLRLTPLPSGAARVVAIDWDRATDAEGIAQASGVAAGIYSLDKGTPGAGDVCALEKDAKAAWVVIAPEAQFNRISPGWKQRSTELTQLERSDAGPDVVATLRHAVLASLVDSPASK
jgi:hypothetical protein